MAATIVFVNGPAGSGKTFLCQTLAAQYCKPRPHYVHFSRASVCAAPAPSLDGREKLYESVHRISYDGDSVFEALPEVIRSIEKRERRALVLVEGQADPQLRCAYPYDHRIFVMAAPATVDQVFRSPGEAAAALQEIMADTSIFASEIFGLFGPDGHGCDDFETVEAGGGQSAADERGTRLSSGDLDHLLTTPLGAEIASRIELHPQYHGIVESDVVLINCALGADTAEVDDCVHRLEQLIARVQCTGPKRTSLFCCDPTDAEDPLQPKLFARLSTIVQTRRSGSSR